MILVIVLFSVLTQLLSASTKVWLTLEPTTLIVSVINVDSQARLIYAFLVYLMHWPVPLNPKGNHPFIPTLPDGTRDVDHSWSIKDTWKQMEALVRKGRFDVS